jgi:hypothetical protein
MSTPRRGSFGGSPVAERTVRFTTARRDAYILTAQDIYTLNNFVAKLHVSYLVASPKEYHIRNL